MKMKILAAAATLTATLLPSVSYADLAYNVGLVSDYRYRGISQTRDKFALQGGLDFTAGGFYLGLWASQIKWIKDFGGDAGLEVDLYGGYKGEIVKDVAYDVGVLTYQYPTQPPEPQREHHRDLRRRLLRTGHGEVLARADQHLRQPRQQEQLLPRPPARRSTSAASVWCRTSATRRSRARPDGPASYTDYSLTASKDFSGLVVSAAHRRHRCRQEFLRARPLCQQHQVPRQGRAGASASSTTSEARRR
jgi:uncharacterized protein (TIGR02001 family)